MGNCANTQSFATEATGKSSNATNRSSTEHLSTSLHRATNSLPSSRSSFISNSQVSRLDMKLEGNNVVDLEQCLEASVVLLRTRKTESDLTNQEVDAALHLYHEIKRLLSMATRSGDLFLHPSSMAKRDTTFQQTFQNLQSEFDEAQQAVHKALSHPAAVQPLSRESLQNVDDLFILDNSLRETTVGAEKGHTLNEKHRIVEAMADTGLEEVILGTFGSKIAVDSQIAEKWTSLGKSFDSTWAFSEWYDMEPYDENELWDDYTNFTERESLREKDELEYYTPPANPKTTFSESDLELMERASSGFLPNAFGGRPLKDVLKSCESDRGRVPLGLLMMAGYGVCNAILEIDTSLETFDYDEYDMVERCKFLIQWCKDNLPRRQNVRAGEDNTARVFINLRDFSNYPRSEAGLSHTLQLVDELSSVPAEERPFGFMMEEPTGWLFPDEVSKICRMIRLTMNRAGFPQGKFLVHVHWYFGLAEAAQLAALCNGADGIWAAVCRTGAQTGHACSTMTAVNLYRAGQAHAVEKYDLGQMLKAARKVTEITTRQPCPPHEEIYGALAFDVPFFMTALPSCRYSLFLLLKELDIPERTIRINELCPPSAVRQAMEYYFGPPDQAGWDPKYVGRMWEAIHEHLLTGLSRDYNSALGLGHLYSLVSRHAPSNHMVETMVRNSEVSDNHPTVLEFIQRWNRLCAKYEGEDLPPHPATLSKSVMMWGTDYTADPRRLSLPFEFFTADVLRSPVVESVPRLMKLQELSLLTNDERLVQKKNIPEVNFYDMLLRLKLFIMEADSLGVLSEVDDFCVRRNHDYFFGEETLWPSEVRGSRPAALNKLLSRHIDFIPKFYAPKGNNAMVRSLKATAKRLDDRKSVDDELHEEFRRDSVVVAVQSVLDSDLYSDVESNEETNDNTESGIELSDTHIEMLMGLASDEGQDTKTAIELVEDSEMMFGLQDCNEHKEEEVRGVIVVESTDRAVGERMRFRRGDSRARLLVRESVILKMQQIEDKSMFGRSMKR